MGEAERLAREAIRVGRGRTGDQDRGAWVGGRGEDRPDAAHRVTDDAAGRDLGPGEQGVERGQRVEPELTRADRQRLRRVGAVAADIEGQAVVAGRVQEDGHRQRPVAGGFPAVHEHDPGPGRPATSRDEPGRQIQVRTGAHGHGLERQAEEHRA